MNGLPDGPRYIDLRRRTETRLRDLFISVGGRPERRSPHYFVLGTSPWFAGLYDDALEVTVPLAALPPEVTSLTGTDSVTALELGVPLGVHPAPTEHAGNVYLLDDIQWAVSGSRGPTAGPSYDGHQSAPFDHYVEVQLWSDDPVSAYL